MQKKTIKSYVCDMITEASSKKSSMIHRPGKILDPANAKDVFTNILQIKLKQTSKDTYPVIMSRE